MSTNPLLTVVTAVRKGVKTLSDTLQSVHKIGQTIPLEHWVIDGSSQDGTVELLEKCQNPELRWISEPDGGLYEAINKGVRRAAGEWIAILNADDFYLTEYAKQFRILFELADRERSDYLFGPARFRSLNGETDQWLKPFPSEKRMECLSAPLVHPATILRRDMYDKLGVYREDLVVAADTEKMFQLLESGARGMEFFFPLIVMREGGVSYRSYEIATLELLSIHKQRRTPAGFRTV